MAENTTAGAGDSGDRQGMTFWLNDEPTEINRHIATKQIIRAELSGSTVCTACGLTVRSQTPILAMCRKLLSAGINPDQALEIFRGNVLAVLVRSIGEAGRLAINGEGNGFRPLRKPDAASPMRSRGNPEPQPALARNNNGKGRP